MSRVIGVTGKKSYNNDRQIKKKLRKTWINYWGKLKIN